MATERVDSYLKFMERLGGHEAYEVLIDKTGKQTGTYPHVQITHRTNGSVDVIAWNSQRLNVFSQTLNRPGGNQLHAVVEEAKRWI